MEGGFPDDNEAQYRSLQTTETTSQKTSYGISELLALNPKPERGLNQPQDPTSPYYGPAGSCHSEYPRPFLPPKP